MLRVRTLRCAKELSVSMNKKPLVYLDWAATAPLSVEAHDAMLPYLAPGMVGIEQGSGNANSLHSAGRDAFKALEAARRDIARSLDARGDEIVFTSGATEADNTALIGIVEGTLRKRGLDLAALCKEETLTPSVVVSAIEHDAVLQAADLLVHRGIEVVYVKPDRCGHITPQALQDVLNGLDDPVLVSIMALNNETGAVMDIPSLATIAHGAGVLFHTDATQALGKIPLSVKQWGIDALSLSSHKVGGPKGVGALYLKARTPFLAQMVGGGQESNRRSGTQNIAGAVGFAAALRAAVDNLEMNASTMERLRDRLFTGLCALPGVEALVDQTSGDYAPHIVTVSCPGFESETLILQLDKRGICVSGGSACASHSLDPSHVLSAMGIDRDKALSMLRFSLGPDTTEAEIAFCIDEVREVLNTTWN